MSFQDSAGSRALQAAAQNPACGHGAWECQEDTSFPAQDAKRRCQKTGPCQPETPRGLALTSCPHSTFTAGAQVRLLLLHWHESIIRDCLTIVMTFPPANEGSWEGISVQGDARKSTMPRKRRTFCGVCPNLITLSRLPMT